jgi:type III pantothenate kinase
MHALLAVDVGNRLTKGARFEDGRLAAEIAFITDEGMTPSNLRERVGPLCDCAALAVCSVVPGAAEIWAQVACSTPAVEPFIIRGDTPCPLINRYQPPEALGPDRLAGAVAAYAAVGGAVIVAMLGTAITVDAVSAQGEFLGGAIAPGVHPGMEGLTARAAQLSPVRIAKPDRAIAQDTDEAMRAGVVFGAIGQVRELVARMRRELGAAAPVILSGGDANLVAGELEDVHSLDRALVLRGVYLIWRHNEAPRIQPSPVTDGKS